MKGWENTAQRISLFCIEVWLKHWEFANSEELIINYRVVHISKAVQNITAQSRISTCILSTVKFVSASKFWSFVILFFPRNRLSRLAKVSMFSIACKMTKEAKRVLLLWSKTLTYRCSWHFRALTHRTVLLRNISLTIPYTKCTQVRVSQDPRAKLSAGLCP